MFPTPKQNGGAADVSANQKYQTGWNEFKGNAGTENFWVIWSEARSEIAEKSRENAFQNGGKVADKELFGKLEDFLENNKSRKIALKDVEKNSAKSNLTAIRSFI